MRPSLFKIGLGLMMVGIFWLSVIFFDGDRVSDEFLLKYADSAQIEMIFQGKDIGYYKIFLPEFEGTGVFVQILDQNYNIITDGTIETKMSVGYFDYENEGKYFLKITNLSNQPMNSELEFGETNSKQMFVPGLITLIGGLSLVFATYIKLRNYRIAQPDENIS